jgi:apolipoprotein D and lipocalin family protein
MIRPMLLISMAATAPASAALSINSPVADLDLSRYLGQWHEIAHLPMFFQRKCVDQISATYTANPDGTIGVHNACRAKNGAMDASDGVAKKVAGQTAALKVRFAPSWLSWLPMVWADYWVVDLDPNYQWAVVGGPSRKYMWVLSRSPSMSRSVFDQIRQRAQQRGYSVNHLVMAAPLD